MIDGDGSASVEIRHVTVERDADLSAARATIRSALAGQPDGLVHTAELVGSELITNALLHGGGVAAVSVTSAEGTVRIEVSDRNRRAPVPASVPSDAMTGRGLSMVSSLATRWGVIPADSGKTVWVELDVGAGAGDDRTADEILNAWPDLFDGDDTTVLVQLGDVPTDLLVAAKRHVDNLVREFALAARGEESGTTAPIPTPLAELIERIVDRFESARLEMKRQAQIALGPRRASHQPLAAPRRGERRLRRGIPPSARRDRRVLPGQPIADAGDSTPAPGVPPVVHR